MPGTLASRVLSFALPFCRLSKKRVWYIAENFSPGTPCSPASATKVRILSVCNFANVRTYFWSTGAFESFDLVLLLPAFTPAPLTPPPRPLPPVLLLALPLPLPVLLLPWEFALALALALAPALVLLLGGGTPPGGGCRSSFCPCAYWQPGP